MLGRGGQHAPHGGYDDGYGAFSYQLPNYNVQANFNMSTWPNHNARFNQPMYAASSMQTGVYPNATASGSPMNFGAYYPPTSYGGSPAYGSVSTGPPSRGTYATSSAQAANISYTAAGGSAFNQYGQGGYQRTQNASNSMGTGGSGTSGGYGNGYTATSGASYTGFDSALMAGMQNMSFGK
jgi:hypothetical protein